MARYEYDMFTSQKVSIARTLFISVKICSLPRDKVLELGVLEQEHVTKARGVCNHSTGLDWTGLDWTGLH